MSRQRVLLLAVLVAVVAGAVAYLRSLRGVNDKSGLVGERRRSGRSRRAIFGEHYKRDLVCSRGADTDDLADQSAGAELAHGLGTGGFGEDQLRPRLLEDSLQFGRGKLRIDQHRNDAELHRAEKDGGELDRIAHLDQHQIAAFEAMFQQSGGDCIDHLLQRSITRRAVIADQRSALTPAARDRAIEHFGGEIELLRR